MKFNLLVILGVMSANCFAQIPATCETLKNKLLVDQNVKVVRFLDTYVCEVSPGESSCLMTYESDSSPYPNSIVYSYADDAKKVYIPWTWENSDKTSSGKQYLEHYGCTDKVDYFMVDPSEPSAESRHIEISRETARDAMFCPGKKTFFSYSADCKKEP